MTSPSSTTAGTGHKSPVRKSGCTSSLAGKNQTLVPADARTGDIFDIADKELSALIHEVAAKGAQVVVVTDSCHSGGNTREDDDETGGAHGGVARTAPPPGCARAPSMTISIWRARCTPPAHIAEHGLPEPRHLAIAACQSDQTAKGIPLAQPQRGAFSTAFEEAVRSLGAVGHLRGLGERRTHEGAKPRRRPGAEPACLWRRQRARRVPRGAFGATQSHARCRRRRPLVALVRGHRRHPVARRGRDRDRGLRARCPRRRGGIGKPPLATGIVVSVLEDRASLKVSGGPLDPSRQYVGAIMRLGTPALNIVVDGDSAASATAARVRTHLAASSALFTVVGSSGARDWHPPRCHSR